MAYLPNRTVKVVDADPNQSTKTWLDKCEAVGRVIGSEAATFTVVDTAGTSGSSLIKYIRNADAILVPFKPHVADLEVVVGWFLSLKDSLQERVMFIPNMLSRTKEQEAGFSELDQILKEEGRGVRLPGLTERKAVYPPLLNGSDKNFFDGKLDANTKMETESLFRQILKALES
ncbi:MAG: ParA family protein [Acaryochloris sp. CRU_2_0]|nr:ParA family protein [Acaryochloris sp. CRU_2_0]